MQNNKSIFIACLLLLISSLGYGQKKEGIFINSEVTFAEKMGSVNPTEATKKLSNTEKLTRRRKDVKIPKNFSGRFPKNKVVGNNDSQGPDALTQLSASGLKKDKLETIFNQDGLPTAGSPSDPSGDVGKNYYVQAVNGTVIGIYDKTTASLVSSFDADILWEQWNFASGGDPIILYDQEAERWLITEFPLVQNFMLVAISQTDDPLGSYDTYRFSTNVFPDYPKYGVWKDEYTVTINGNGPSELDIFFINKQDLLDGAQSVRIISTSVDGASNPEQSFIVATPADWSGSLRPPNERGPIALSLADSDWTFNQDRDLINVHSFNVDWTESKATSSLTEVPVSDYYSFACAETGPQFQCIPQKGSGALDGLPEIIPFQPHYRNFGTHESLVFNFITNVSDDNEEIRAGIRWVELRRNQVADWSLYQEGTYAPDDGLHRFMGSIAIDEVGNLGLAYSVSSKDDYVGLRYTGRNAGDSLGVMTFDEEIAVVGENPIDSPFGRSRYGDYPHITIDPIDGRTFWFTSEYATRNSSTSRIIAFKASRPDYDLAPVKIINPQNSDVLTNAENIEVEIKNLGATTIPNFTVGYQYENQPQFIETVNVELAPDESYIHQFSRTEDFSALGNYDLKIFSHYIDDLVIANDTAFVVIEKFAEIDVAATNIQTLNSNVCGTSSDIVFSLQNLGTATITGFMIETSVNGVVISTTDETIELPKGVIKEITSKVTGLANGRNDVQIRIISPNGQTDQLPDNNTTSKNLNVIADGVPVTIDVLTDRFPNETSWAVFDIRNNKLYENRPELKTKEEEHVLQEICLEEDTCYIFTIYDDQNDGLTSRVFPSGSYQIRQQDGQPIAGIINLDFGAEETNRFCVNEECQLEIDVQTVVDPQSGGESIIIDILNGNGPRFDYSIDGGTTFVEGQRVFENLAPGEYTVEVIDDYGCSVQQTVTITTSSIVDLDNGASIKLYPNPTEGIFKVELAGYTSREIFIPVTVLDANGALIQRTNIANYSGIYKGMISLYHYPAGAYFIKLNLEEGPRILQINRL